MAYFVLDFQNPRSPILATAETSFTESDWLPFMNTQPNARSLGSELQNEISDDEQPEKEGLTEIYPENDRMLQDVANSMLKSHKQIFITGAGISTSCGIPDFRSKDGLYNFVPEQSQLPTPPSSQSSPPSRKRHLCKTNETGLPGRKRRKTSAALPQPLQAASQPPTLRRASSSASIKGEDLFHSRVFHTARTTTAFYQFIANLRSSIVQDVKDTSATHKLLRTLRDGGRLMRCYTQNIDGLEAREGLCLDLSRGRGTRARFTRKIFESTRPGSTEDTDFDGGCEVVQLHGELDKLRCRVCAIQTTWTDDETSIFLEGAAPECEHCALKSDKRQESGKRGLAVGELRPNIVLYGEDHPQNTLIMPLIPYDVSSNPDLLVIMGTSLKVHGLQKMIRDFAKAVHERKNGRVIFVNRTRPPGSVWEGIIDEWIAMDCDAWVSDLKMRAPDLWLPQGSAPTSSPKKKTLSHSEQKPCSKEEKPVVHTKTLHLVSVEIPKAAPEQSNPELNVGQQKFRFVSVDLSIQPKRRRKSEKPYGRPKSKVVSVDIPTVAPSQTIQSPPQERFDPASTNVRGFKEQSNQLQEKHNTKWKQQPEAVFNRELFLSPKRPECSPLKSVFKPQDVLNQENEYLPGSPLTPCFSPIAFPVITPLNSSMLDSSIIATPTPRTRSSSPFAEIIDMDENYEACLEDLAELESGIFASDTPLKRQLSFVSASVRGEKARPLFARSGKSLFRSIVAHETIQMARLG